MLNTIKTNLLLVKGVVSRLPKLHIYLICTLFIFCLVLVLSSSAGFTTDSQVKLPVLDDSEYVEPELWPNAGNNVPDYQIKVHEGDTLGEILSLFNIYSSLPALQEADINVLSLDVINEKDVYRFWLDGDEDNFAGKGIELTRMEQVLGPEHQVVFKRNGDGFEYKETILPGQWKNERVVGEIKPGGSFSGAAHSAGLSANDIATVNGLLKDKIDFKKQIRAGDKFQIVLSHQYIGDERTDNTKVEGIRFFNRNQVYSAFSYKDNYYDSNGDGLERAFARSPIKGSYRISSGFNPRRRHPITRLIRPHNGTDFAVRTGTPVYAPGDGTVRRVVRHKYAGLYIELQHSYKYRTRYLHLSKSLVKKGMHVKRGQKIALSGNTGASTGPHLHYEFHVNQKPINPMGNKVPVVIGIDRKSKSDFDARVKKLIKIMES